MCGIVGYYCQQTASKKEILFDMMQTLEHRGPDGSGTWFSETNDYAIGHLRLSIIDINGGKQPFVSEDQNYILTFNGEIYNYIELRQLLSHNGFTFSTYSDTEVLLKMYIAYGEKMLNKLSGMFAISIYDKKREELFLARDHFGIKPLYYFQSDGFFAYASEIKALIKHPKVPIKKNHEKIREYVAFQMILNDETLYEGINKLEPATFIKIKNGKIVEKHQYWDLDYTIDESKTQEQFTSELLLLLQNSVLQQVRSDVPVGSYLSGGIDSSIISILTAKNYSNNIKTFTGGFKDSPNYDETHYARLVSDKINSDHFEIFPTANDFSDSIERIIHFMDEPSAGPGVFPQFMVSSLASKHVKVILGGQGGDELFGGYARYSVAYLEECIKGAILENSSEDKHVVTLKSMIDNLPLLKQYLPMIKRQFSSGLFDSMDARYFKLFHRTHDLDQVYEKDFIESIDMKKIFYEFSKIFNHPKTTSYFNKMTYFDMKTHLPALLQVEDRSSMSSSLESRVPFLDRRIAELLASIPPTMKFSNGKLKYLLIKAAKDILPNEVKNRKDKMGFPTPLNEWMKGSLREFVLDIMLSQEARQRKIYNLAKIEKKIDQNQKFTRDIWGALNLELWQQDLEKR